MNAFLSRLLDAVDATFDALASVRRVLLRGAFRPDAKDYRADRFAPLAASDVFVQTIAINAEDEGQARRAVRLDADRRLPLPESVAAFDVAGPLPAGETIRMRPERNFLLAAARRDALAAIRLREGRRGARIEGFVFLPEDHPGAALLFRDRPGDRRRRFRRAMTALAAVAFVWCAADAAAAWRTHLEASVARAEAARMEAERAIRRDARRLAETRAALASLAAAAPIAELGGDLAALARRLPPHTELTGVEWLQGRLVLKGASYAPGDAELALRRAFAAADIAFETTERGPPDAFEAALARRRP